MSWPCNTPALLCSAGVFHFNNRERMSFDFSDMGGFTDSVYDYLMDLVDELRGYKTLSVKDWIDHWRDLSTYENALGTMQPITDFRSFILSLPKPDFEQATAADALSAKQGEHAPMDNPIMWENIEQTLGLLNADGKQLQADALLDKNGAPSELLKRAIDAGKVPALFTLENWEGADKDDLQSVLRALPESTRQQILNRQQLLATLGRGERVQETTR